MSSKFDNNEIVRLGEEAKELNESIETIEQELNNQQETEKKKDKHLPTFYS